MQSLDILGFHKSHKKFNLQKGNQQRKVYLQKIIHMLVDIDIKRKGECAPETYAAGSGIEFRRYFKLFCKIKQNNFL